jgi:hypothetical protein
MPKKKNTRKPANSSPIKSTPYSTPYRWWQKAIVFLIAGVLVGTVVVSMGLSQPGVETLPGQEITPTIVPEVTEQPVGEVEVTTPTEDPNSTEESTDK